MRQCFWPPPKPKIESYIDLSLKVAMVTENGRKYRLKQRKCLFGPHHLGFIDSVFKNWVSISTIKYQKYILFFLVMYLVTIYHPFKYFLVFSCALF